MIGLPVYLLIGLKHVAGGKLTLILATRTIKTDAYHIEKNEFKLPFVCGAKNLGEALRRIHEGASMIRTVVVQ